MDQSRTRARVLVVDDHEVFRQGLCSLVADCCHVVAQAREGHEAVRKAEQSRPDVVVMDVVLPGMSGIAATREIKQRVPDAHVVILTAHDAEDETLESAIEAGASAFVSKLDDSTTILAAIKHAAEGLAFLPPAVAKRVMGATARMMRGERPQAATTPLSARETQVLRLMALGRRTSEIAEELFLSPRTIGNHIASVYRKLGIQGRASAVRYAIKEGLLQFE